MGRAASWIAILALAGVVILVGGLTAMPTESDWRLIFLMALGCLVLDFHGRAQVISTAAVFSLAAGFSAGLGLGAAGLLVLVGLGARARHQSLSEATVQAFPVLAAAAACSLVRMWPTVPVWLVYLVGLEVYLPLALRLPNLLLHQLPEVERPLWRQVRTSLTPIVVACGFLGAAGAELIRLAPLSVLWLLPAALALSTQALRAVDRTEERDRASLVREIESLREARRQDGEEVARIRSELTRKVDEHVFLEDLSLALGAATSPGACAELLLARLEPMVDCTSIAVFLDEEGALVPVAFRSPRAGALGEARLLGSREPLVERCRREQTVVRLEEEEGERLFEGERSAVALPLEESGVLYLGRRDLRPFSRDELRLLAIAANQAAVAMRSASRLQSREQALQETEEANRRLSQWGDGLTRLVEGARRTASTLDPERLLDLLLSQVGELFPAELVVIELEGAVRRGPRVDLEELRKAVVEAGRPLLFEDISQSRFQSLGFRSLLAVPLIAEDKTVGLLVVAHPEASVYNRQHQDLMALLAYQAAASLESARAYKLLQESKAQLFQSSKMAAVGQLAAGVAHELNTPLGSTIIAIEAAAAFLDLKPEASREKLDIALRESLRARDIIRKMLYYSRDARHGRGTVEMVKVVEDTLALNRHQFGLEGVRLEACLEPVPPVVFNENELQQVLVNLLLNARDALSEGQGGLVTVSTRQENGWVVLEVGDDGPGVPDELADRIFEPFFTTKPVGRGTGLGLSVSREIVEGHGGELVLVSGSTFQVRLPLDTNPSHPVHIPAT